MASAASSAFPGVYRYPVTPGRWMMSHPDDAAKSNVGVQAWGWSGSCPPPPLPDAPLPEIGAVPPQHVSRVSPWCQPHTAPHHHGLEMRQRAVKNSATNEAKIFRDETVNLSVGILQSLYNKNKNVPEFWHLRNSNSFVRYRCPGKCGEQAQHGTI